MDESQEVDFDDNSQLSPPDPRPPSFLREPEDQASFPSPQQPESFSSSRTAPPKPFPTGRPPAQRTISDSGAPSAPRQAPRTSSVSAPAPASASAPLREDLITQAVRFLTKPEVKQTPLARRVAFLEHKGLNSSEVKEALRRAEVGSEASQAVTTQASRLSTSYGQPQASNPAPSYKAEVAPYNPQQPQYNQPYPYPYPYPPPMYPQRREEGPLSSWSNLIAGATLAATLAAGLALLGRHFIAPWLEKDKIAAEKAEKAKIQNDLVKLQSDFQSIQSLFETSLKENKENVSSMKELLTQSIAAQKGSLKEEELRSEVTLLRALLKEKSGLTASTPAVASSSSAPPSNPLNSSLSSSYAPVSPAPARTIPQWQRQRAEQAQSEKTSTTSTTSSTTTTQSGSNSPPSNSTSPPLNQSPPPQPSLSSPPPTTSATTTTTTTTSKTASFSPATHTPAGADNDESTVYSQSFMKIAEMVSRGEMPTDIKDIDDKPRGNEEIIRGPQPPSEKPWLRNEHEYQGK